MNIRTTRSVAWKALGDHPVVGFSVHSQPELLVPVKAGFLAGSTRRDGARAEKRMKLAAILLRRKPADKQTPGRAVAWRSIARASNHSHWLQGDASLRQIPSRARLQRSKIQGALAFFAAAFQRRAQNSLFTPS